MPKPPRHKQPVLPPDVALQVANAIGVSAEKRAEFCDVVRLPVRLVWELHGRAVEPSAKDALYRASQAARALQEAFEHLEPGDREWVEEIWAKTPQYKHRLPALPRSVSALGHLFSIAVGKAPLQGDGLGPNQRGRRTGDVEHLTFREFVHFLLVVAEDWCGVELTFDKNYETGTLIEAIEILREHLPEGVVPIPLPLETIQRVKTNRGHHIGFPDIDFFQTE